VSSFEFILVAIAIVVGFAISEILGGFGRQLRYRHEVPSYPLQVVAGAYLLSLSFRYLWMLWGLRGVEWSYPGFLLAASPSLVLALAAHLSRVEVESLRRTPREQYFDVALPFYGLLACFPLLGAANAVYNLTYLEGRFGTATGAFQLVWPLMLATSAWLAVSRRPRDHWIGLGLLWAGTLIAVFRLLPRLD